jgi:hypothetical protein
MYLGGEGILSCCKLTMAPRDYDDSAPRSSHPDQLVEKLLFIGHVPDDDI